MSFKPKSLLLATTLGVSAFAMPAYAEGEQFVLIQHSPDSESWWNTVKNAATLAAEEVGANVEFRNSPTGDLADMARIIEQTTAENPDGIIVTIADFDELSGPIQSAVDQGIPVVTINTGTIDQSKELGALLHIGQPEYDAGFGAGERAKAEGATSFLCVNNLFPQSAGVDRCNGFADGLGVELGDQMIDSGQDLAEIENRVKAYLTANPDTQAILTLGPMSADPTIKAIEDMGLAGEIFFATFDLDPAISQAIKDGTINFAVDQQPFLQGYLPVALLHNSCGGGSHRGSGLLSAWP